MRKNRVKTFNNSICPAAAHFVHSHPATLDCWSASQPAGCFFVRWGKKDMRILTGLKRFFQFAIDPDTYCLLWLALRNHNAARVETAPAAAERKKGAAGNAE
jgi:hypothetical protein